MKSRKKTTRLDAAIAVLLVVACVSLFLTTLDSGYSAFLKFLLSVALLAACGYGVALGSAQATLVPLPSIEVIFNRPWF